jgi:DNA-binding FrmR family transcriptional regulator
MKKKKVSSSSQKKAKSSQKKMIIDFSEQMKRLNKIHGQISGVKRMLEGQRSCSEVMMQTSAVCSAIRSLEASLLQAHLAGVIHECVESKSEKEAMKKVAEIGQVFKKHL